MPTITKSAEFEFEMSINETFKTITSIVEAFKFDLCSNYTVIKWYVCNQWGTLIQDFTIVNDYINTSTGDTRIILKKDSAPSTKTTYFLVLEIEFVVAKKHFVFNNTDSYFHWYDEAVGKYTDVARNDEYKKTNDPATTPSYDITANTFGFSINNWNDIPRVLRGVESGKNCIGMDISKSFLQRKLTTEVDYFKDLSFVVKNNGLFPYSSSNFPIYQFVPDKIYGGYTFKTASATELVGTLPNSGTSGIWTNYTFGRATFGSTAQGLWIRISRSSATHTNIVQSKASGVWKNIGISENNKKSCGIFFTLVAGGGGGGRAGTTNNNAGAGGGGGASVFAYIDLKYIFEEMTNKPSAIYIFCGNGGNRGTNKNKDGQVDFHSVGDEYAGGGDVSCIYYSYSSDDDPTNTCKYFADELSGEDNVNLAHYISSNSTASFTSIRKTFTADVDKWPEPCEIKLTRKCNMFTVAGGTGGSGGGDSADHHCGRGGKRLVYLEGNKDENATIKTLYEDENSWNISLDALNSTYTNKLGLHIIQGWFGKDGGHGRKCGTENENGGSFKNGDEYLISAAWYSKNIKETYAPTDTNQQRGSKGDTFYKYYAGAGGWRWYKESSGNSGGGGGASIASGQDGTNAIGSQTASDHMNLGLGGGGAGHEGWTDAAEGVGCDGTSGGFILWDIK